MIREARERTHLSLDDMAAHTKLARATLEALERDDYGALLEPVYVRGYYRKCAKVLEMDEAQLIAAYNAQHGTALQPATSRGWRAWMARLPMKGSTPHRLKDSFAHLP